MEVADCSMTIVGSGTSSKALLNPGQLVPRGVSQDTCGFGALVFVELDHVALFTHARHGPCRHTCPHHRVRVAANNEQRAIGGFLADAVPGDKLAHKTIV